MLKSRTTGGFTLVELMVGLTIVGVVIAVGMPEFTTYLQGSKLASSAYGYLSGIQLARAEAIRRNLPVQFILTDDPISTPNIQNAAALNPLGKNWLVRVADPATGVFALIQAKSAQEGANASTGVPTVLVAGTATLPAVFDGSITFNGFGATGAAYQLNLSNPSGGACAPAGPMRCPQVRVTAGGQVSLCDPTIVAVGDSRAC